MTEALPYIVPTVLAVITYLLAPPLVARVKGTAEKEQSRHTAELRALEEWRKAREGEHITLQAEYKVLKHECDGLRHEIWTLKRKEEELVEELSGFRRDAELMDRQITNLRNDNYRLMQKIALIERESK
jgi:predicted RNase H-like nuclease (RuvC/YqgF family)